MVDAASQASLPLLSRLLNVNLSGLTMPPEGKTVTATTFTVDGEGDVETITYKQGAEVLFTLTFGYDAGKNVTSIIRS